MEKQRVLPELNLTWSFRHLHTGGLHVGKEGMGWVPTHPQPQDGMDTLTPVPEELCPVSCIPNSMSTMHHWPRPLHHCGRLGHRGTTAPTSP